ncbi:MAG TPA: aldo/keto reductase [Candidatus Acidoferrales bacterium]|nr:aldo/keto reductase [Candidatus Acidoferrales bacterium]
MPRFATPEATRTYAEGFSAKAGPGHFRVSAGLTLSSIGIGTYLGEPDQATDRGYTEAIVEAALGGINVLDSAINYRFQRSERSMGAALAELATRGVAREALLICTKGGYLTPDGEMPANAREYFAREYFATGILCPGDVAAGCHSMAPRFLEDQLARSLRNLGVEGVDVYYLHNPETQLEEVSPAEFRNRLRAAFEFLEGAVGAGKIARYGLATWNGFRQPAGSPGLHPLADVVAVAREAGGDAHHFGFVQLPISLMMPEAIVLPNHSVSGRELPLLAAASELGVTVIASAPTLQGRLAKGLPQAIAQTIGLGSDFERAVQFARSAPALASALVGMSRVEHARANLRLVGESPLAAEKFWSLFRDE